MSVTLIAVNTATSRADGDAVGISITHGLTLVDGDYLIAFLGRSDDLGTAWQSSGWSQVGPTNPQNNNGTGGNDRLATALYKKITNAAGEPSSYTFVTGAGAGTNCQALVLSQWRGVHSTGPFESDFTPAEFTNDFTPSSVPGSMTVTNDGSVVCLWLVGSMNDGVSGKTGVGPSGYTLVEDAERVQAGELGVFVVAAYKAVNAGSELPGGWANTPDDSTTDGARGGFVIIPEPTTTFVPSVLIY